MVFFMILLSSSTYAASVPSVQAAEATIQQKGLSISGDVLGLDMTKYAITTTVLPQNLYIDVVPQETVRYYLDSNESKLDMLYTFTEGKLRRIHVLESAGFPFLTKSVTKTIQFGNMTFHMNVFDEVENAKDFLEDYQSYSGKLFYGELASMLNHVEVGKNLTETFGNVKFEATTSENSETFTWTYTFNGIEAPDKCVALGYRDGFLKYFIDNWDFYRIGSTAVKISEKEAIDIAMERARTYSWKVGSGNNTFEVEDFNVSQAMVWETIFRNSLYADEARGEDLLMLYPMYHVWVSLDKFYPGNVYGFNVYVWADTGKVFYIHERVSTVDPPADLVASIDGEVDSSQADQSDGELQSSTILISRIVFPVSATIIMGTILVWVLLSRKKNLLKSHSFKIGGIGLCFLMFSALLFPVLTVNAVNPTRRALIWGSESTGAPTPDPPDSPSSRKTWDEILRQRNTAVTLSNYFKDDGYVTSNYQGSLGSFKA